MNSGVTNIYRRAEDIVYELIYSSDSIDVASFQSEGKGEIYKVETENVDSLTISSNPPIGFMTNNKDRYSCEIVRTQSGTQSIVRLFAKQLTVETLNTAIPTDFGEGRYLYAISEDGNCCYKFDSSLFVPGNYEGAGVWTVDPLVATIQLPIITDGYDSTWQFCFYEKSGDIICIAGSNEGARTYGQVCRIKPNDQVWNLDNTIQNAYTNSFKPNTFTPIGLSYDYEKNIAYVRSGSYFKGIKIDLNVNTSILHMPTNSILIDTSARNLAYMASVKRFFSQCEIDYENDRNYSQLIPVSVYGWSLPKIPDRKYAYYSGVTICNIYKVDSNQVLGRLNDRYSPYYKIQDCVGSPNHNIIIAIDTYYQSYSIVKANSDPSLETIKYWMADINNFPGDQTISRISRITCCDYPKLFFVIIDDAVLGDRKRLLIIDPDNEVQPDFGYYSMPSKISHFSPNQLL